MSSDQSQSNRRFPGLGAVILLSALSMLVAAGLHGPLKSAEQSAGDMLMRFRYAFNRAIGSPRDTVSDRIVYVAIDSRAEEIFGRFGAGSWITREPFIRQMSFFNEFLNPSVISYDLVLRDALGEGRQRVSEDKDSLAVVTNSVARIAADSGRTIPGPVLSVINRLSMEQGNRILADVFASSTERGKFSSLLGGYLIGGTSDPREIVHAWDEKDIAGESNPESQGAGSRVPYLNDMAIPAGDVYGAPQDREDYAFNASLSALELLDYSLIGLLNGPRDHDGIVRRLPTVLGFIYVDPATGAEQRRFVPSFAISTAILHLGLKFPLSAGDLQVRFGDSLKIRSTQGETVIPIDQDGYMSLNYTAKIEDFATVSFANITPGTDEAARRASLARIYSRDIDGRAAILGVSLSGVDIGSTPLAANTPLVATHLAALNNILTNSCIAPLRDGQWLWLMVLLFAAFTVVCCSETTVRLGPSALLFAVLYVALSYSFLHFNKCVLPVIGPLIYIGLCSFSVISYRYFVEERDRRKVRGMFSTMVSEKVLRFLEENPESFSLKGRNVETTVFFSDVAKFSGISEKLSPDRLIEFLNSYLTPVTNSIVEHGGYVDKYIGDGVMAVWGTPFNDPNHAVEACVSAIEQQQIISRISQALKAEFDADLSVRMGISSGVVTAGNMGSEKKFQFTVIGDTVNLASRLESANREFGTRIIISEKTFLMARDAIETRALGRIVVMGRTEAVPIYELLGEKGRVPESVLENMRLYEEALDAFLSRQWSKCIELLDGMKGGDSDGPSLSLRRRTVELIRNPPPDDWNGAYISTVK